MTTPAPSLPAPAPARLRSGLLLAATVLLAAVGPALVVHDRWLERRTSVLFLTDYADRFPLLRSINLPAYALLIGPAFLILLALGLPRASETLKIWRRRSAFARRPRRASATRTERAVGTAIAALGAGGAGLLFLRQAVTRHIPGPELAVALGAFAVGMLLREVSTSALRRAWRRSRGAILSILAAHAAVILALASCYSFHRYQVPLAGLALLAVANLALRVRRTGPVPLLVLAFVCLYTWRINAWWFALVGDEYRNWDLATLILNQNDRAYVASHLFQLEGGLEGLDPYFCSLIQATTMRVLGVNSFGWRFSSLYLAAVALAFFHRFFRTFLTRRAALATTVCLGASHYIIGFGKIGYDKFQAYFAMALLLAAAGWAVRTRRTLAFVGLGFAAGLCFWVYPAALYILPLPAFLLVLYAPPLDRKILARWALAAATAVLSIFPLPFQPTYFEGKRPGTIWNNPALAHSPARLTDHFVSNLAYTTLSPILLGSEDHFVTSSYLDPLTGLLFSIGLASLVWLVRRDRFVAFLVVSLAFLTLLAGTTHDREYPPTTRMFLFLPLLVLFASAGLWRLLALARCAGLSAPTGRVVYATLAAVVVLNVTQAHVVSKRRSSGYQLFEPLMLRIAEKIAALAPDQRPSLVLVSDEEPRSDIPLVLNVYGLSEEAARYSVISAKELRIEPADLARISAPGVAVIASPLISPDFQKSIERQIAATGKTPCAVRTSTGQERFKLWTSSPAPDLCAQ